MPPARSKPSPAILELHDIVVAIATPATNDEEHNALESYRYKGPTGENEAACLVPVLPGSRFCIHVGYDGVSPPHPNAGLNFKIYIDGLGPVWGAFVPPKLIAKRISQIAKNKPITAGDVELTGREMDDGSIRPFCFTIRRTTDNDEGIPPPDLESIGEVMVAVWWVVEDPEVEALASGWEFDLNLLSNPINEKFKKAQHRCAGGLGQAEIDPDVGARISRDATRPIQAEAFVFKFKYQDAEWLKAERVIPHARAKGNLARRSQAQTPVKRHKATMKKKSKTRSLKKEPLF